MMTRLVPLVMMIATSSAFILPSFTFDATQSRSRINRRSSTIIRSSAPSRSTTTTEEGGAEVENGGGNSSPPNLDSPAKAASAPMTTQAKTAMEPTKGRFHPVDVTIHHTAIKTRNITTACQFYSLFGFELDVKFLSGTTSKGAWLKLAGSSSPAARLELLEVPSHILDEPEGMKRRGIDLMKQPHLLGHNHLALDVTESIRQFYGGGNMAGGLQEWINALNERSIEKFGRTVRMASEPVDQLIVGNGIYELAFLYDADGALIELINRRSDPPEFEGELWDSWVPYDCFPAHKKGE